MKYDNTIDEEYLGGYITKITHYDDWDEWVHRTCTRQVPAGRDSKGNTIYRTETYDCSYRDYHPERWCYTNDKGYESYFYNKAEFDTALKELGNPPMVFRDMHRHYYTKDGDAQDYFWDGKIENLRSLAWKETYKNKIMASSSVMKFEIISKEKAKELGLYDYPEIMWFDQNPIVGYTPSIEELKQVKYVNSIYGRKKQFRVFILVWENKPISISEEQRSYWQGGNKNEFVVCLGYDKQHDSITWCNAFSWCDNPKLEIATKRYFLENTKMNLKEYAIWLEKNIRLWKRKEFKDFEYLQVELSNNQQIFLFILAFFFNVCIAVYFVVNEIENTNLYDTSIDIERIKEWYTSLKIKIHDKIKKYYEILRMRS